jgi:leucyl/phenylalanyl-tRNA--protein transferase
MFPPVESADEDGFLGYGGEPTVEILRLAYASGIFPWPGEYGPMQWFAPPRRALLFLDEFHVGSRLRRTLTKNPFEIRVDTAFEAVLRGCAAPREGEPGTWITPQMQRGYLDFHRAGHAHSVEAWQDGQLVGGLYGVSFGAYFGGESMFYRVPNASKAALVWLIEHLKSRGSTFIDCQTMTPHFAVFGAREIERSDFMAMLEAAMNRPVSLFD